MCFPSMCGYFFLAAEGDLTHLQEGAADDMEM